MDENRGETRSLNVIGIPAELFHQFKANVVKRRVSIKMVVIDFMEKFVAVDNPGDDVKKKTFNSEKETKRVKEIVEEIFKSREAQEDLKNSEKEPVDESLEVRVVEKLDEIRTVKEPEKEPAEELEEEPAEELEEEPVIEEPVIEEPGKAMAAEKNPGPDNPRKEGRGKKWYSWIPFPPGFERRKK